MAKYIAPTPKLQFFDANGNPLVGGKLYTYAAGTTTPLATYTDYAGGTPNANPVILDSRGEASVWMGASSYKFTLKSATDVLVWTVDSLTSGDWAALAALAASGGSSLVGFLQAGTDAVARTVQSKLRDYINVKDFGALGDASTDDTLAINAAIFAASGRALYFPGGTYKTTGVTVAGLELQMFGDGHSRSQLSLIAGGTKPVVKVDGSPHFVMMDMSVDGNKANCASGLTGVRIVGVCTGPEFHRVFFVNCKTDGLSQAGTVDYLVVKDCISESNGNDGFAVSTATSCLLSGNRAVLNGRFGIVVTGALSRITDNICTGNCATTAGGSGLGVVNAANYSVISGNQCLNNGVAGSIYAHGIGCGASDYITITGNYCASNVGNGIDYTTNGIVGCNYTSTIGNVCLANLDNGIAVDSRSTYGVVANNVVIASYGAGIFYYASAYGVITSNELFANGLTPGTCAFAGSGSYPYGIYVDGYASAGVDYYGFNTVISNNVVQGSSYAATGAGIKIVAGAITPALNLIINENQLIGNTISVDTAQTSIYKARDNYGWLTQAEGTGTIAAAATAVTITHGLAVTPVLAGIQITSAALTTVDVGQIYITAITATQFTVNCRNVPGVSTFVFTWRASTY